MTMERVYNPKQQHEFQQQVVQANQYPLHSQQQLHHQPNIEQHQHQQSYRHHNHHIIHQQHLTTQQNQINAAHSLPQRPSPPVLHRPVHPPPPPPSSLPSVQHQTHDVNLEQHSINPARLSAVAPNRHPNLVDLYHRRSMQIPFYVNTHYQLYQPSNLQTNRHQHHQFQLQYNNYNHSSNVVPNDYITSSTSEIEERKVLKRNIDSAILAAREALEKPIEERDDRDIFLIDDLCSQLHGFDAFPKTVRRALAAHAVIICIGEKGKELIVHNEELDSFCVLISGECEQLNVAKTQPIRYYTVGDAFGVCEPTTETVRFVGYLVTRCEICVFLCVKLDDFYTVFTDPANYPSKDVLRHRDASGNVICVSQLDVEKRSFGPIWSFHMQSTNPFKVTLPDGHIIVKATESFLLTALVDGYDRIDVDYVDDFLLLFRVFMTHDQKEKEKKLPPGMIKLCLILVRWLDEPLYRDKVVKVVLTWLSSYYHDFELNSDFSYLFFKLLESKLLNLMMHNQLHLLHVTLSTKSKTRVVTISRSSREQPLPFSISGGYEKNCGIFVTQVFGTNNEDCPYNALMNYLRYPFEGLKLPTAPPRSRLYPSQENKNMSVQLRPGDQVLEVNGTNFAAINLVEAQKKLDMSTHLSLTVRYNPSAFHEMRALPEGRRKSSLSSVSSVSPFQPSTSQSRFTFNTQELTKQGDQFPPASPLFSSNANFGFKSFIKSVPKTDKSRLSSLISSSKQFVRQIRDSTNLTNNIETMSKTSDNQSDSQSNDGDIGKAKSNPDLPSLRTRPIESGLSSIVRLDDLNPASIAEQATGESNQALVNVLRVFNAANNESRYLLIHEETTAREVVMVAVKEFNLSNNSGVSNLSPAERTVSSLNWHLYEVSVVPESKTIKQKCLSEQTSRLADRASLCSRFYIKNNSPSSMGPSRLDMGDDTLVNEILKESPANVTLSSLNATLLAVELTLSDFDKFRGIEPQQFVYDTFFDYTERNMNNNGTSNSKADNASLRSSSSDGQDADTLHTLNKTRCIPKKWMKEYQEFADISNKEMFWVVCEILNERNIGRRVKIVKQFVRVADVCSQLRNYNSMFAIISGLGHSCVYRLRKTFEKLKPKYKTQLEKMRSLFDPSKNMSTYRTCLNQSPPPAIPLFPQIKKDLTFTKEGRSIFIRESNDQSDDEDSPDNAGYSQDTVKRKSRNGDLLSVKSSTMDQIASAANGHTQQPLQTRSISYTAFNGSSTANDRNGLSEGNVLVNFAEIRQFTERVRSVVHFSSVPYSNDLLTNTKDNQRNQAQIKKMHEEWQMRKRIRHYISLTLDNANDTQSQTPGWSRSKSEGNVNCDQTDSSSSNQNGLSANGKLSITYDERTLYQRSLEIEPELNATSRPVPAVDRQQPTVNVSVPLTLQTTQLHPPNQPQAPPAALNMQPPSIANSSPTLSKSSSLSSCSSFSHHLPATNYHAQRGNLMSSVGKFGTESTESLRKLQALSENMDNWRPYQSNGNGGLTNSNNNNINSNNNNGNMSNIQGLSRLSAEQIARTKGLVASRMFMPKNGR